MSREKKKSEHAMNKGKKKKKEEKSYHMVDCYMSIFFSFKKRQHFIKVKK